MAAFGFGDIDGVFNFTIVIFGWTWENEARELYTKSRSDHISLQTWKFP